MKNLFYVLAILGALCFIIPSLTFADTHFPLPQCIRTDPTKPPSNIPCGSCSIYSSSKILPTGQSEVYFSCEVLCNKTGDPANLTGCPAGSLPFEITDMSWFWCSTSGSDACYEGSPDLFANVRGGSGFFITKQGTTDFAGTFTISDWKSCGRVQFDLNLTAIAGYVYDTGIDCQKPWYKMKNTSFYRKNALQISLPTNVYPYDSDDDSSVFPMIGDAGIFMNKPSTLSIKSPSQKVSADNWVYSGYISQNEYVADVTKYKEYVMDKPIYKAITNINQIESEKVNIYSGNLTLNHLMTIDNGIHNAVLFVDGDITLDPLTLSGTPQIFNQNKNSIALISSGDIKIHSRFTELHGIFIAGDEANLAYDVLDISIPLKIDGNLISNSQINSIKRSHLDVLRPSLFISFNSKMYIDLLPFLSTQVRQSNQIK